MPGTLNVGGHNIITHSGTSGAGDVTVNVQDRLVLDSSGNVGIGTSSPTTDANGEANNLVIGSTGTTRNGLTVLGSEISTLAFGDSADKNVGRVTYNHISEIMQFYVSDSERMRIDSSGNLLVGTTSSTGAIAKGIAIHHTASSGTGLEIQGSNTGGTYTSVVFRDGSGTDCGSIDIDATANTTAYTTSSDYRLKSNIKSMTDSISRLKQLNPCFWNWISAPDVRGEGFIAHEVQTIVPEAISGEKDAVDDDGNPEYQGIDQSKLVPLLTAALQESIALIESQQSQIDALTAKTQEQDLTIASLISRIEALENA